MPNIFSRKYLLQLDLCITANFSLYPPPTHTHIHTHTAAQVIYRLWFSGRHLERMEFTFLALYSLLPNGDDRIASFEVWGKWKEKTWKLWNRNTQLIWRISSSSRSGLQTHVPAGTMHDHSKWTGCIAFRSGEDSTQKRRSWVLVC